MSRCRSPRPLIHALSTLALGALALSAAGCGYRVAGQADTIPDQVRTIAVPAFANATTEYKIEQYLTRSVVREFLSRTRYDVIENEASADATLRGTVVSFVAFPANFDQATNRATAINTITQLQVTLVERETGRVLYQNPNLQHRERYEVSSDPEAYFEERQAALTRSSDAVARTVVSAVLEGF